MRFESELDLGGVTLSDVEAVVEAARRYGDPVLDLQNARLTIGFDVATEGGIPDLWDLYEFIRDELDPEVTGYGARWLQQKPLVAVEGRA